MRIRIALVVLIVLGLGTGAMAERGVFSIKCDGRPAEAKLISDQRGAEIRALARTIASQNGYVVYRIPVGTCMPQRVYYSVSRTRYALEFSSGGRSWSSMVDYHEPYERSDVYKHCASGFTPEWQKAARKTGAVYIRVRRPADSKAPLTIQSIIIEVIGDPLPSGYRLSTGDFGDSWLKPDPRPAGRLSTPGVLMILLGLLAVVLCQWRWKTPMRLFWLGALLWMISVAVKFAIAIPLNNPMDVFLHHILPNHPADLIYWAYGGLLTGLTEVNIFLVMTGWFRRRSWGWKDAASVGIGFGAVESILLGVFIVLAAGFSKSADQSYAAALERSLVILVHLGAVVAAIHAVTRRRWGWYAFAFIQKSWVDAIACYLGLAGQHFFLAHQWYVELVYIGPFAYIAIPVIWILKRQWKPEPAEVPASDGG